MKENGIHKAYVMHGRVNKCIEKYSWEILKGDLPGESKVSRGGYQNGYNATVCTGFMWLRADASDRSLSATVTQL